MGLFSDLVSWTTSTFAPMGLLGLFILSFIESSFFPIPPDVLIIVLVLDNPSLWPIVVIVATIGSVLGGIFGYGIGYVSEEAVLRRFISRRKLEKAHSLYNKYESWAVFIGGFTPLPYKVFSISAGLFYVRLRPFIVATTLSRGLRFLIVALLIVFFGKEIVSFIDTWFNILTLAAAILAVGAYFWYYWHKKKKKRR